MKRERQSRKPKEETGRQRMDRFILAMQQAEKELADECPSPIAAEVEIDAWAEKVRNRAGEIMDGK